MDDLKPLPSDPTNASLSACDTEAIHVPQAIQPYGVLLSYSAESHAILRVSENFAELAQDEPRQVLGRSVWDVLGRGLQSSVEATLAATACVQPSWVATDAFRAGWQVLVHRAADEVVIEWLQLPSLPAKEVAQLQQKTLEALRTFARATSLRALCDHAVSEIRSLSHFDRVMVYAFDDQANGEVLAEARSGQVDSYMGLRFPASDIPKSARELYTKNHSRLVHDVSYRPVALLTVARDEPLLAPLDQTQAALRSISPVHREYLRNMGVRSSMSFSLMRGGSLWGLISCANCDRAADVSYPTWIALETIAEAFAARLSDQVESESLARRQLASGSVANLSARIVKASHFDRVLWAQRQELLELVQADGAALAYRGDLMLMGQTPPASVVRQATDWLGTHPAMASEGRFAAHALTDIPVWQQGAAAPFCGILAIALTPHSPQQCLLWFRKEVLTTTNWGGNPNKPVGDKSSPFRVHPRKSFEMYKEVVRNRAVPWSTLQIDTVRELKAVIVDHLIGRTERLETLNAELRRSNLELDSFAYAASHDLKEPIRGIHHYANFLQREQRDTLTELGHERLRTITRLTRRMDDLLNSLLEYAKVGRAELNLHQADFRELCVNTVEMLRPWLDSQHVRVAPPNTSHAVVCDGVRVMEILSNLIVNGAKYNDKPSGKYVEVGCSQEAGKETFFVRDNGIGIAEENLRTPFQLFRRLHAKDAFGGGSGTGLTLAKAIVERHGGQMWLESALGAGTTVKFTLAEA